jgi:site-specific recombinase XerD
MAGGLCLGFAGPLSYRAAGVDDRVIADLFGHSDVRSVLPYAKVQTAVVRNALGQLKHKPL